MSAENSTPDSVIESLILDLLEWVAKTDRSYEEVMDAWRTSCPRLPVWEEANDRGVLGLHSCDGRTMVRLTPSGLTLLQKEKGSRQLG